MRSLDFCAADGRSVFVAIDHALYSWPCAGLDGRRDLCRIAASGAAVERLGEIVHGQRRAAA